MYVHVLVWMCSLIGGVQDDDEYDEDEANYRPVYAVQYVSYDQLILNYHS